MMIGYRGYMTAMAIEFIVTWGVRLTLTLRK